MKLYLVGAGGTASYMAPALVRSLTADCGIDELIIIDRDKIEERNLERQLFTVEDIEKSKAEVLRDSINEYAPVPVTAITDWFSAHTEVQEGSFIISMVDNHVARLAILEACDLMDCRAVLCGNETYVADAFYYEPSFKDTPMDPRVRYPEIVTDKTDDPTNPSCNDAKVLEGTPQLATANFTSACFGLQLFQLWHLLIKDYDLSDRELRNGLPLEYSSCKTGMRTINQAEMAEEQANE